MLYSVECLQTGRTMSTGMNSETEREALEAMYEYIKSDCEPVEEKGAGTVENVKDLSDTKLKHYLRWHDLEVYPHSEPLEENLDEIVEALEKLLS